MSDDVVMEVPNLPLDYVPPGPLLPVTFREKPKPLED